MSELIVTQEGNKIAIEFKHDSFLLIGLFARSMKKVPGMEVKMIDVGHVACCTENVVESVIALEKHFSFIREHMEKGKG